MPWVDRLSLVALGAAVVGCGLLPRPDVGIQIAELDTNPRQIHTGGPAGTPTGPAVEILRGRVDELLSVVVQRDADGVCLAIFRGGNGSTSCGPLPAEAGMGAFGSVSTGGGEGDPVFEVGGIVDSTVSSVVLELGDGSRASALLVPLAPAEIDASAFLVYLPQRVANHLVAYADDGTELGRLTMTLPAAP